MKKSTVTAIVPAYNEEKNIRHVLESLKEAKRVDEIICVNDGSTDKTLLEIESVDGIKIIDMPKNSGKSKAVVAAIREAKGDIVVFIDADLKGTINTAADALVSPLLDEDYDVTVGYPLANQFDKFFRPLSGERAYFKKDIMRVCNKLEQKGYGMELFLNFTFKDKRIKCFPLDGIIHQMKHEKQTYKTVVKLTVVEVLDILSEVLSQKNPPSFFLRSYVYSFYLQKPVERDSHIDKLVEQVREFVKKQLFE